MIAGGIEYLTSGSGEPVICLHGIGSGAEGFRPQLEALTDFQMHAWMMPGYGKSDFGEWPTSFSSLSQRLGKFVGDLSFERVHLIGASIGGMLALEHAFRVPEQVTTLTLIGTTPAFGGKDDGFKEDFLAARLDPLEGGLSMSELAKATAPHLVGTRHL